MLLASDAEDLVLRVARPNHVLLVDFDERRQLGIRNVLIAARRWLVGEGNPARQRQGNVQVLGQYHIAKFIHGAMQVRVARIPTCGRWIAPALEKNL